MHIPAARIRGPYSAAVRIPSASQLAVGKMESTNPINFIEISTSYFAVRWVAVVFVGR